MKEKQNFDCVHRGDTIYMYDKVKLFNSVLRAVVDNIIESDDQYIIYILRGVSQREILIDKECLQREHYIYSTCEHSYVICTSYREAEGRRRKSLKRKIKGSKKRRQYYIYKREICELNISYEEEFIKSAEQSLKK